MHLATLASVRLPNHSIRLMAGMLAELGIAPAPALTRAGLSAAMIQDPSATVTGVEEIAFQRAFMEATPDRPDLWLELGARYRLLTHAHTDYGLLMSSAPTMEAALKIGLDYGDLYYMLADAEQFQDEAGRLIGFRSLPTEMPADLRRFAAIRDVGVNCTVVGDLWGGPFPFEHVELPVPASDEPFIRRFLPDATLVLESEFNCWRWSVPLDRKPPQSDPILHEHYRQRCDRLLAQARRSGDVVDRVAGLLEATEGHVDMERAASELGVSTRTLQRRLGQRGLSFRELAGLQRHRHACRLLTQTDWMVSQIAFQVGYDNVTSFNCAFRRMAGTSPTAYRRALYGPGA
jgi:AraC-like DNA-binding protein